ncbi:hypothetical protein CPC08DRAFT_104807 [Agrocybe pediades]|nr:hypothetical protein CPC08DRAFT_104807 [Agrocybe pediades]
MIVELRRGRYYNGKAGTRKKEKKKSLRWVGGVGWGSKRASTKIRNYVKACFWIHQFVSSSFILVFIHSFIHSGRLFT